MEKIYSGDERDVNDPYLNPKSADFIYYKTTSGIDWYVGPRYSQTVFGLVSILFEVALGAHNLDDDEN